MTLINQTEKKADRITAVAVAQLPLKSKKAITQLQFVRFKDLLSFTEKWPL